MLYITNAINRERRQEQEQNELMKQREGKRHDFN